MLSRRSGSCARSQIARLMRRREKESRPRKKQRRFPGGNNLRGAAGFEIVRGLPGPAVSLGRGGGGR